MANDIKKVVKCFGCEYYYNCPSQLVFVKEHNKRELHKITFCSYATEPPKYSLRDGPYHAFIKPEIPKDEPTTATVSVVKCSDCKYSSICKKWVRCEFGGSRVPRLIELEFCSYGEKK